MGHQRPGIVETIEASLSCWYFGPPSGSIKQSKYSSEFNIPNVLSLFNQRRCRIMSLQYYSTSMYTKRVRRNSDIARPFTFDTAHAGCSGNTSEMRVMKFANFDNSCNVLRFVDLLSFLLENDDLTSGVYNLIILVH